MAETEINSDPNDVAIALGPNWLDRAASQLLATIAPQADRLDGEVAALEQALHWLGHQGWLTLKVPQAWGGPEIGEADYGRFREAVARCSGALAFLQGQHQSATGLVAASDHQALKAKYLPAILRGQVRLGIAFSHLRRTDPPPLTARAVAGGWDIDGTAPWVTGLGYFSEVVLGAATEQGTLLGIVPMAKALGSHSALPPIAAPAPSDPSIAPGLLMPLVAMRATNTAAVTFRHWFLPDEQVVGLYPGDWMAQGDRRNVLKGVYFPLGCTQAALDRLGLLLCESRTGDGANPQRAAISHPHEMLQRELNHLRQAIYGAVGNVDAAPYAENLRLRAQAIALMGRAIQAAALAQGGRSGLAQNPVQRLQGEASIFAASGQTPDILAATLAALANPLPTDLV